MIEKLTELPAPSDKEPDKAATDSVFDFLYHDARRVASYLAQFNDFGSLTSIQHTEAAQRAQQKTGALSAEGGLAGVAKAGGSSTAQSGSHYQETAQRVYDPLWTNALSFLDFMQKRDLLRRDLQDARIGQIVMFSGDLSLFDLGVLKKMWDLPAVKKAMLQAAKSDEEQKAAAEVVYGNRKERRKAAASFSGRKDSSVSNENEVAIEMLSVLPHMIQMSVSTSEHSVWACLREEFMVGSPSELMMKHGLTINGTWHIVGVVDALPDGDDYYPPEGGMPLSILQQMVAGSKLGYLAFTIAGTLIPPIRQMLGRPRDAYGLTPLLVFREISQQS